MLSLAKLASLTPKAVRERSRNCRATPDKFDAGSDENGNFYQFTLKAYTVGKKVNPDIYTLTYKLYDPSYGRDPLYRAAWVQCTCPYFLYYDEVAVAARKSTDIVFSNGKFPIIRNPRMIPYVCKHLFAGIPILASWYKTKTREIYQKAKKK